MSIDINKMLAKPQETIREHTDSLLRQAELLKKLDYIKSKKLYSDLLVACEYHDYGKGNSEFQKRILCRTKFNSYKEIPHSILSLFFVEEDECIDYASVCFAVLYHHYHDPSPASVLRCEEELVKKFLVEMIGDGQKLDDIDDRMDDIGEIFHIKELNSKKLYAILLKGFLHKCDYSASAGIACEYKNDFLLKILKQWQDSNEIKLNELQRFCIDNSGENIIVTAPTGMGKTEAGLLWCGDNKCFFVLPLKTAINAMYDRIKGLSGNEYKNRVALIHSDMKSQYLNNGVTNENGEFDFDYCLRSRQMSLPITVCTPDQIFDFVLKYPGYEYKLATASYSRFIIDEIQMYSPDLLAAIIYAVKLINKAGGKIAILTATLPPFVRKELYKILGDGVRTEDFSAYGKIRHNVKAMEKQLESSDVLNRINECRKNGNKKFLVVCNSIDTADKIYSELLQLTDAEINVQLFHAGFIKADRAVKERQILQASKDTSKTEIWISTSVVEASLDIDFDILFTELSDLFSLFQRFGRVNRKGMKSYKYTNCYVFTQLQGNAKKYHFTDDTVYTLSKQAVLTLGGVITEEEKTELIDSYLSVENIESSKYYSDYCNAMRYLENLDDYMKSKSEGLRSIDRVDVIPQQIYDSNEEEIERIKNLFDNKSIPRKVKLEAYEKIMSLTVAVSRYNVSKKRLSGYVNAEYLSIPIFGGCDYSFERGLVINKLSSDTSDNNDTDNFI